MKSTLPTLPSWSPPLSTSTRARRPSAAMRLTRLVPATSRGKSAELPPPGHMSDMMLCSFAIVNGQISSFAGSVQNSPANYGRAVTLTGILPGCSIGLVPQQNCALWSIIDTSGCATARSVTFSN